MFGGSGANLVPEDLGAELEKSLKGAYTVDRELGGGGMSRVFLATDTRLKRKVVVKVLAPELAEGVSSERFEREITLAAALQHPQIVPLLSAGEVGHLPYYIMPFVEGDSLRDRLKKLGTPSTAESLVILRDVARALAYAHGKGVMHRDIKPENVLLSENSASVTDFGIAKALAASRGDRPGGAKDAKDPVTSALTAMGTSIGTPSYMPPEQALGDPDADHRVDVYAFGCMAYELFAGHPPFHNRSLHQLIMAHVSEAPVPIEQVNPTMPPTIAALIGRCLEKDPENRPQTAAAVLEGLDASGTQSPSGVHFSSAPHHNYPTLLTDDRRILGRLKLSKKLVLPVGVGVVVAVVAFVAVGRFRGAGGGDRSIAVLPFENRGGDTANVYFADGMADELISALAKVQRLRVAARSSSFGFRGKGKTAAEVGRALKVSAVLEGSVQRAGNNLRLSAQLISAKSADVLWSESYTKDMKDIFAVQDDIARQIVDSLRVTLDSTPGGGKNEPKSLKGTANIEAYELFLKGLYFYQRRGPSLRKAADFYSQAIAKDSQFARAYAGLSLSLVGLPAFVNTKRSDLMRDALSAAKKAVEIDGSLSEAQDALALVDQDLFRWSEAGSAYAKAIKLDPAAAILRHHYGRYFLYSGRIAEGLHELEQSDALDPFVAVNIAFLAHALSLAGQHGPAVAAGRRALGVDSMLLGAQGFTMLGLLAAGKEAEASALAKRALRPKADIHVVGFAAYTLAKTGDRPGAMKALEDIRTRPGEEHRRSRALATAYLGVGDTAQALKSLEEWLDSGDARPELNSFSDPMFDPLRGSKRFAEIIKRFGLDARVFTSQKGGRP